MKEIHVDRRVGRVIVQVMEVVVGMEIIIIIASVIIETVTIGRVAIQVIEVTVTVNRVVSVQIIVIVIVVWVQEGMLTRWNSK
jgi:hypothetical protein